MNFLHLNYKSNMIEDMSNFDQTPEMNKKCEICTGSHSTKEHEAHIARKRKFLKSGAGSNAKYRSEEGREQYFNKI